MSVTFPEGIEGEGNVKVVVTSALANPAAPTLAEVTSATNVDLTCYITGDGFAPGGEQETRTDRRLCSRQVFGVPGSVTYTIEELVYVYDPQAVPGDPENRAYEKLAPNSQHFLMVRWGLPYETAFAAGQKLDVYPITAGAQFKNPPTTGGGGGGGGDSGTSKLTVRQTPYIRGVANIDAVIAA